VLRNPETSPLSEKEKLLLRFVRKVTFASANINAADTESLRAIGWDDTAIFYAITACALFNFYNRWVSASGMRPVSDETFRRLAAPMAERGYLRK
jgi:alkylhydroperoxidase family enzyme